MMTSILAHAESRFVCWPTTQIRLGLAFAALSFAMTSISAFAEQTPASPAVVSVQGSTTFNSRILQPNLPAIEAASGVKLDVVPNKSIWGLIALFEKRAELAMVSADLKTEVSKAKLMAPTLSFDQLQQFQVARVSIAFITNPANPVHVLSHDQLKQIFSGKTTNWKDVGGPDFPIRVVATQNGGGTVIALRAQVLDGVEITATGAVRLESARHVVNAVEQLPGALGVAQTGLATKAGVSILDTGEPIEQLLNFVTLGAPSEKVKAVIEATREVVEKTPL